MNKQEGNVIKDKIIKDRIIKDKTVKNRYDKVVVLNKTKYVILTLYALSFIVFGFIMDHPKDIFIGMQRIIISPDLLITDYIAVGGIGATFVNAGVLTLATILLLYYLKITINGISIASIFLMSAFALFGKNIVNVWVIIAGVYLYAKVQKDKFSKYIYIALFGTSMAPIVSECFFGLGLPFRVCIGLGIVTGLGIGFILPPLASHMMKVHQGYSLYNIGFTSGIIGTIVVSIFKSYGYQIRSNLSFSNGNNISLGIFLSFIFLFFIITGYCLNDFSFHRTSNIFQYSGKLVTDYVILEGFGPTLINMGINGFIGMGYVLLVGGPLNGPTMGGILAIAGFGAFGKHAKNITPIFLGVVLGSISKIWNINDPSILLAALFGTSLAPIAGQFGWKLGVVAGFINSSVVLSVGALHGGLNLYNTGFSAGIVAAAMIPMIEALRKEDAE